MPRPTPDHTTPDHTATDLVTPDIVTPDIVTPDHVTTDRARLDHTTTDRLRLDRVTPDDLDDLAALHAEARVWTHLPSGRHTSREQTGRTLAAMLAAWNKHGLGYWTVRSRDEGGFLGVAGCAVRAGTTWWNVYYRFRPEAQGHGYAVEATRAAIDAAHAADPGRPVVAFLLENNEGSRRAAERSGLRLIWRGPDTGNTDPDAVRLVFADRPLTAATLLALVELD